MGNLHIVVAETMGTDGEFFAETYPCKSDKDAFDTACGLIADMADEISALKADNRDLHEYVEELDDDLQAVEDFLDEEVELDDEDEWDDEDECDGDCDDCELCGCCEFCDDEDYFEIICPSCGETICFDESVDPEALTCPACGEKFGCIVDEDDLKKIDD